MKESRNPCKTPRMWTRIVAISAQCQCTSLHSKASFLAAQASESACELQNQVVHCLACTRGCLLQQLATPGGDLK